MKSRTHLALERFAQNSKLLSLLDHGGIERLAACAQSQEFAAHMRVVSQGDPGDSFYLIAKGEVRVLVGEQGDEVHEVARLGSGQFFGEISVVSDEPRTATVETAEITEVIRFAREPVLEILRDYPRVREVLGSVGLQRTEANMERQLATEDGGLADLLEGEDD